MGIKKLFAFHCFLAISLLSFAQKGTIKGLVTDTKTKEALVGATIMLEGTTIGTITDFDGNYLISNIPPGTYNVRCSFISYEMQSRSAVKIDANQELTFNFELGESTVEIGGVEVVAKINRQSEAMLLIEQKNSVLATQAVGAQEISRKGASDAEGAVTKVSGISKQDGVKNVFVRGLGDRFNTTSLNGFPVPSEDPEYKNISLDFFSSDMIQSVGVSKVFNAEISGDVGGAQINILSKELSGEKEFAASISSGMNTRTLGADFLKTDGVNGFGYASKKSGSTNLQQYIFANSLEPDKQNTLVNQSVSVSGGKKYRIGANKNPLHFFLLGQFDTDYSFVEGQVRNTTTTGTIFQDQQFNKSSINASHLLMANLDYRSKKGEFAYNGLYIHTSDQAVGNYHGRNSVFEDAVDFQGFLRRQQVNDNSLLVNQLSWKQQLKKNWNLELGSALNRVKGNEPDRRINYLSAEENGNFHLTKGTGRQQRYFSALSETDLNLKAGLVHHLKQDEENVSALRFGYNGRLVQRNFEATEYDQQVVTQPSISLANLSLDSFFNQQNLENNKFILDRNQDEYSVDKFINSGYGELTWQFSKQFIAVGGLRAEQINMTVDYNVNRGGTQGKSEINELYILPDVNLKYNFNEKTSLRVGASRTYTLPQAKEISPFRYIDVSFKSQGNPDLKSSINYNFDLKLDYYLSNDELFSVSGFYKYIQNPISRVEKASAGGFLTYDNIADHSMVEGVELEVRKNIFKQTSSETDSENKLSFGLNASYILTKVKLEDADFTNNESDLEGAAPLIINADLSHTIQKKEFSLTNSLVFSYFSDRVYTIGTQGYQDIVEKGIPTLDFISSAKINKHWGIGFKARNLLDPAIELSRKPNAEGAAPIILNRYKKGISMSLSLQYKF